MISFLNKAGSSQQHDFSFADEVGCFACWLDWVWLYSYLRSKIRTFGGKWWIEPVYMKASDDFLFRNCSMLLLNFGILSWCRSLRKRKYESALLSFADVDQSLTNCAFCVCLELLTYIDAMSTESCWSNWFCWCESFFWFSELLFDLDIRIVDPFSC